MSDQDAAVTVVIPCFEQARFLGSAVASVRRQSHPAREIIVVDDGSTDDTSEVAGRLGVRLLRQRNRGLSEARNAGLAAACGELVVFLDADDELLPGGLAEGVAALASAPHAAAAVGLCTLMDEGGRPLPVARHAIATSDLYREWLSKNFVWTPGAAMFRRDALLRSGGFPPRLGPAADYAVYLRLARTGTVVAHDREVVRYRQHHASMSRDPARMLRLTLAVLRRERRAAPVARRRDIDRGRRAWREWYGEQIVERLRASWRARLPGPSVMKDLFTLAWLCPGVLLRHARRKAARIAAPAAAWQPSRSHGGRPGDERAAR